MAQGHGTEENTFENNFGRRGFLQIFEIGFEELDMFDISFLFKNYLWLQAAYFTVIH